MALACLVATYFWAERVAIFIVADYEIFKEADRIYKSNLKSTVNRQNRTNREEVC